MEKSKEWSRYGYWKELNERRVDSVSIEGLKPSNWVSWVGLLILLINFDPVTTTELMTHCQS